MILLLEATNYDTDITVKDITRKLVNEEDTARGILNSCIDDALLWEESITQEEREDFWENGMNPEGFEITISDTAATFYNSYSNDMVYWNIKNIEGGEKA